MPLSPTLLEKIPPVALDRVQQPIERATGMANAAYTDPEAFVFERDHVFASGWTALAYADELESRNSVKPVDFMGLPLLLTRNRQDEIKVFHNVCSHRGTPLATVAAKTNGLLVCPYHAWSYDLDGNLKATPHIGGVGKHTVDGFSRARHALKRVRSHIWLGVIFINLSADAAAFERHAEPLLNRYQQLIGDTDPAVLHPPTGQDRAVFEIGCNWKLAIENFTEAYHLPWIHPDLNRYSPLQNHHNLIIGDDFSGQITTCFNLEFEQAKNLPLFADWPPDRYRHAEYPTFYPNLMLGFQANHIFTLIVRPVAVDRVVEDLRLVYVAGETGGDDYADARRINLTTWKQVFVEDVESVERMQRGRQSSGFQGGVFSPVQDTCSLHFHQWVARKYQAGYAANGHT